MHLVSPYALVVATLTSVDWKTILDCVNVVTIVGVTLGLAGVIVGVLGWRASIRGLRESAEARAREKTAQDAANAARQELLLQRAAEDFRIIVESVEDLTRSVASGDWAKVRALLPPLKRRLSEANGSFQKILKGIDMDKLDVAISSVRTLVKVAPVEGAEVSAKTVQSVTLQCDQISELVDEIYGKLKYLRVEEVQ
ncbi:MAG: hypothetical protein WCC89_05215 [Candidatus Sulfotelmatobacter sp.]